MRLSYIKRNLEEILPSLNFKAKQNNNNHMIISDWERVNDALYKLYNYDFLMEDVKKIFARGSYVQTRVSEIAIPNNSSYTEFVRLIEILKAKCHAVIDVIAITDNEKENQLNVKLPPINDLKELDDFIKDFDNAFSQCPIFDDNIQFKFDGVESGSSWLIILVVGAVAGSQLLKPIAEFIKDCFECRKIFAETNKINLESRLLELEIDEKIRNEIIEKNKERTVQEHREMCLEYAKKINPEKAEKLTPEEVGRLVFSFKTIADLFNKGMEIHPSNCLSEEEKAIFPFKEEILQIYWQQKLLTGKNEGKTDETKI